MRKIAAHIASSLALEAVLTGCDKREAPRKEIGDPAVAQVTDRGNVPVGPEILTRVKKEVGDILKKSPASIRETDRFVQDLGGDSLDAVEIVMATEDAFGIAIADADAERLMTVEDLARHVDKLLKASPAKIRH